MTPEDVKVVCEKLDQFRRSNLSLVEACLNFGRDIQQNNEP